MSARERKTSRKESLVIRQLTMDIKKAHPGLDELYAQFSKDYREYLLTLDSKPASDRDRAAHVWIK